MTTTTNEYSFDPVSTTAEALLDLGMKYCSGLGVAKNYVEAHKWFNIAALKGSQAARQYRTELALEMSVADIAYAQREARSWLTVH